MGPNFLKQKKVADQKNSRFSRLPAKLNVLWLVACFIVLSDNIYCKLASGCMDL